MTSTAQFEAIRRKMTLCALVVTILYVVFLIFLTVTLFAADRAAEIGKLKPNEFGDLLAGIGGPIALIWLVYGYFLQGLAIRQQGIELSQNTKALHLQAESLKAQVIELSNSVEQQKNLVNLTQKQIENAQEASAYEKEKERRGNRPRFTFGVTSKSSGSSGTFVNFSLWNAGNTASDVRIITSAGVLDCSPAHIPLLRHNDNQSLQIQLDNSGGGLDFIKIIFNDAVGSECEDTFVFCREKSGQFDHFMKTSTAF